MNNQTSNKRLKSDITPEDKNMEGVSRSLIRDAPPSHFRFKIESFLSLASVSSLERYESREFDGGDYKWRLALYPKGNKKGDGKDHISLYLLLDKTCHTNFNQELSVAFTFLAYDQIRDKYWSVQGVSRFHAMKTESGIDRFLPLKIFNDPSNGYLVNNTCMFGAEVFVIQNATKGQCLSMVVTKPVPFKYIWKVENFSRLEYKDYYSDKFTAGGHDWTILFYPKGDGKGKGKGNNISLFLHFADSKALLTAGAEVLVEYKLRIVDQINGTHCEKKATICFNESKSSLGWSAFLSFSNLYKSAGYLLKDTCILEAEVCVLGSARNWD